VSDHAKWMVMVLDVISPCNRIGNGARDRENRFDAAHIVLVTLSPSVGLQEAAALSVVGTNLLPLLNVASLDRSRAIGRALALQLRLLRSSLGRPSIAHQIVF